MMDETVHSPYGDTTYQNYDPEQIEDAKDVMELFRWIAEENSKENNHIAQGAFHECADVVEQELVKDE